MLKHDARFVYLLEIAIFPTHLITRIHVEQSMLWLEPHLTPGLIIVV